MKNKDNKEKLIAVGIIVAVLLLFGGLFVLTTPSKSKIKSKNTVAKKSAPLSTIFSPPPTTALPAPNTPYRACKALIGNIVDKNYQHPTLNPAVINSLAVPKLAQAILSAPHMTPGEIAQQEVLNPSIAGGEYWKNISQLSVGFPVNLTMNCYVQKTSPGHYIVTKLVRQ